LLISAVIQLISTRETGPSRAIPEGNEWGHVVGVTHTHTHTHM